MKEPRTIVFDVSGVIDCNNEIAFTITPENAHVTIAGETSPHGVAIYNYRRFDISGEEVIMRSCDAICWILPLAPGFPLIFQD